MEQRRFLLNLRSQNLQHRMLQNDHRRKRLQRLLTKKTKQRMLCRILRNWLATNKSNQFYIMFGRRHTTSCAFFLSTTINHQCIGYPTSDSTWRIIYIYCITFCSTNNDYSTKLFLIIFIMVIIDWVGSKSISRNGCFFPAEEIIWNLSDTLIQ